MKVFIAEGAKRGGNTSKLAAEFARGAQEAGHEVERASLFNKRMSGCIDCQRCQQTGVCVWKDDAPALIEQALAADVLVFASPVYYYGITAQLKCLLDRFYAYHGKVADKRVYFLTSSAADHDQTYGPRLDGAEASIRSWVDCFGDGVAFERTIGAWNMFGHESVEETPAFAEAYEAGRSLQ